MTQYILDPSYPLLGYQPGFKVVGEAEDGEEAVAKATELKPEIARLFEISMDGVKRHIMAICRKLGASNRSEAVAIASRRQLLKS